ncbi:hypothetical protein [Enterobacter hormaechei]|uniref:hypothetical protein n=1 Tax=Enterobacter hormaechei TaxID=158836 RepID=UPI0026EDBA9E|nr:hypothetical protein [Enterobacter hormaechei]
MFIVTSECVNYTPITHTGYTLGDFAEELIRILPKSPDAFTRLVSLVLNGRFGTEVEDAQSMIGYIAESVGEHALKEAFAAPGSTDVLTFSQTPVIDEEMMHLLDDAGMQLAILLTRHMYGDLSETDALTAATSKKAMLTRTGSFKTSYLVGDNLVTLSTDMNSRIPQISLT